MSNAISVSHLTKKFKDVVAVDDISFNVKSGEIFGILGLNGAGKTTTIKMISGLTRPKSGDIKVFDYDIYTDINKIKSIMGVSPQDSAIANNLSVKENIELMAKLYFKDKNIINENVTWAINELSLNKYEKRLAKTLSGGYKRRLSIAMALVTKPRILFLDEPTLGLDVINRHELWNIINELKGKVTIILTSHYMEEISALVDNIAIMKDGHILLVDNLTNILKNYNSKSLEEAFIKIVGEENA